MASRVVLLLSLLLCIQACKGTVEDRSSALSPQVGVFEDPGGELDPEAVSRLPESAFRSMRAADLNLGLSTSVYWLRLTLDAETLAHHDTGRRWLLDVEWPFQELQLFWRDAAGRWWHSAGGESEAAGPEHQLRSTLRLPLPADAATVFYLRVKSRTALMLPLRVLTEEAHDTDTKRRTLLLGIYFGIMLSLALYSAFLYLMLRDPSYFWYVIYIIFLALYFFGIDALLWEFVELPVEAYHRLMLVFIGFSLVAMTCFTRSFLMLGSTSTWLDRIIRGLTLCFLILTALSPFADVVWLNAQLTGLSTFAAPYLIVCGVIRLRRGFRPARYFVLAWSIYMTGAFLYALTFQGLVGANTLGMFGLQIGSAVEAILLSLALGDRIQNLRKESEEYRRASAEFKVKAITDALTGLYNSRHFREQIGPEVSRSLRLNQSLALILLDIDNFKKVNDTHGHDVGDKVLAMFGELITSSIRGSDIGCRYGGEEFAVILPGTTGHRAMIVAERIRSSFAQTSVPLKGGAQLLSTVSVGVAELTSGMSNQDLVKRADEALYEAKHRGKNRVVLSGSETASASWAQDEAEDCGA